MQAVEIHEVGAFELATCRCPSPDGAKLSSG